MDIRFDPITPDNFDECIGLSVREDQRGFVADNLYSIAQAKAYAEWTPEAIVADGRMVGFVMHKRMKDDDGFYIIRYMIDQRDQRSGYGRAAMRALLKRFMAEPKSEAVTLSVSPENTGAVKFYETLGFRLTGVMHGSEAEMEARLAEAR